MRVDHPGGAPNVNEKYRDVFKRVEYGKFILTDYGRRLVESLTSYPLSQENQRTKKVSEAYASSNQYIVDTAGQRAAVILPIQQYEQLLEDLHDLAVVAERREEETISLEEMKHRLKADGLL